MNHFGKNALIFVLFTILFSCEYELEKEFFNEVQKPEAFKEFDLSLIPDQDTIKLFVPTSLKYDVNTSGYEMIQGYIIFNGNKHDLYYTNGSFHISPEKLNPGTYNFKIEIFVRSGTGSVADYAGGEGYLIEKEWIILIDGRSSPKLDIFTSITEDGYMKVSWEKNEQINFDSYELLINYTSKKIFSHPDSTFYIDSSFYGGTRTYIISSKVSNSNREGATNSITVDEPFPTLYYSEIGLDSVRVYWDKSKFNCKYSLIRYGFGKSEQFLESSFDTSIVVPQIFIGKENRFILKVTPDYQKDPSDLENQDIYGNYNYGEKLTGYRFAFYVYDPNNKVVYTKSDIYDIEAYDISSMSLLNSVSNNDFGHLKAISANKESGKVAAAGYYKFHVYDGKDLNEINTFDNPKGSYLDYFNLINDSLIALSHDKQYIQYNLYDENEIASIDIDNYPRENNDRFGFIATSSNGRYTCMATENGINIYKIENGVVDSIYSDTRAYHSVMFNEENPEEVFLTLKNDPILEKRNVLDFSLLNKSNLPTGAISFRNEDPETGYLLMADKEYLYILDEAKSNVLLKIMSDNEINSKLYGSKIFSTSGYYLDIAKYLPL
ncbi:hypothetical protein [Flexithrix dorotheae]|uniref:hypothetical protein n=1 Tax=Flexithrix dorotheae TaxID=70993 RepID=UPI0012FC44C0|nr:hypothetical protein [Flexithrix dorotheae]